MQHNLPWIAGALGFLASSAAGQAFVNNTSDIPSGNPNNNSLTENVDFADIDLDGDWDAAFADGGDGGNDQNRIWLNRGPGQVGLFQDVTSTRAPAFSDDSRDVEFVDFDNDGDVDVYISNTAQISSQSNRWWLNTGTGSGFYSDETSQRWVNVGQNDGVTTFSSVSASTVLLSGGFIDWSCDCDFADLDNDGDLDLFHSSYGGAFTGNVPSRIFLNDGAGFFEEFNPSGAQLTGSTLSNGTPAIWASGVHQGGTQNTNGTQSDIADSPLDIDLGDFDGDLDIDILHGARNEVPRIFENRYEENGKVMVAFRDVTFARLAQTASGGGNYEQEIGDIDGDGDLDIYGLNWQGFNDIIARNDGTGSFSAFTVLPGSGSDDNEGDFLDYDNDGDLDLFVANFSGSDKLYRNDGNGNFVTVNNLLPGASTSSSLDADAADLDNDGDYDIMVAEDGGGANIYLENVTNIPDTTGPTLFRLEQAPDRVPGAEPTVVRVQVYDNAPYYVTWYNATSLEVTVNGGPVQVFPMLSSGGQIFRGEIPGNLSGTVCYQVVSSDQYGNTGQSNTLCFDSGGPLIYCTPKLSSSGCMTMIGTSSGGTPVSGDSDYSVTAAGVQGLKNGLLFAGISGPAALPFLGGTLCVTPPTKRGPLLNAGGSSASSCDGSYSIVINDGSIIPLGLDAGSGNTGWYQWWYRDPNNGAGDLGTALSDGLELSYL